MYTTLLLPSDSLSNAFSLIPFAHPENHPDVLVVNQERESISIDQVRALQHEVLLKPYQEEYKVVIILDAHLLQIEAQHALLKLLEEPPKFVQCILLTPYPHALLPTILSRCMMISEEKRVAQTPIPTDTTMRYDELLELALGEKLELAKQYNKKELSISLFVQLLTQTSEALEKKPSLRAISHLKTIQKGLSMLQRNTHPQLVTEWMLIKLNKS